MREEKRKTPRLRFPGFDGDWEQRKLEDISANYKYSIVDGPFGSDLKTADYTEDGVLVMQSNYITSGRFEIKQPYYVSSDKAEQLSRCHCKGGDILIAKIGANFGICNIIPENIDDAVLSSNCMKVDLDEEHDNEFYKQYLNILYESGFYYSLVGITAQPALSLKFMKTLEVPSTSNEEQRKIASFFDSLDNHITLHERKIDQIKEYKKGMLQRMFPKKGETVPEVRFPGFEGDWEQRKLESLCDVFTDGDWIEAKDQSDSGIRLVQTGNVGTTEYLDKENNKKWISEETFERLHCKEIYEGDILISRLPEPAGRACIMPYLGTRMITAVDCTIIRTSKEYDSKYLVQYLSTPMYFKAVNSFLGGGTRQRISRGNLSGIDIPIPVTIEEQKKIGDYFSNLDNLITLHQQKIDEMKEYKKGLLQQMFV